MAAIKRVTPDRAEKETNETLKEISEAYATCQKYSDSPERFRVTLPSIEIIFNDTLALDLMPLEKRL